ncbi:hypothetical protein CP082626L3_0450 [Chlamydia psittaci 08-2626_L3]|nr:hypothetical protein CP082626L3_0450 [Chlamydia psittaci 08-2626_L3]
MTSRLGKDNVLANKAITASLAFPFSGTSVTRIFNTSPSNPTILFSLDFGVTFTSKIQYA